jgi:hypothetical protein
VQSGGRPATEYRLNEAFGCFRLLPSRDGSWPNSRFPVKIPGVGLNSFFRIKFLAITWPPEWPSAGLAGFVDVLGSIDLYPYMRPSYIEMIPQASG